MVETLIYYIKLLNKILKLDISLKLLKQNISKNVIPIWKWSLLSHFISKIANLEYFFNTFFISTQATRYILYPINRVTFLCVFFHRRITMWSRYNVLLTWMRKNPVCVPYADEKSFWKLSQSLPVPTSTPASTPASALQSFFSELLSTINLDSFFFQPSILFFPFGKS